LVVDGGSSDDSVDIIRRYEPWIAWWCSEPDRGQADALNKALEHATGTIFNWVNSDDRLEPGALETVAGHMTGDVDAVAGSCRFLYEPEGREEIVDNRGLDARKMITGTTGVTLCQPSLWLLTDRIRELGGFNPNSHFYFDAELFIRYFSRWPRVRYLEKPISTFRIHGGSKTGSEPDGFRREYARALRRLAVDAPTRAARRLAADRLRELEAHSRFLAASRLPSRRQKLAAGLAFTPADLRPSLIRVRLRWLCSYLGLMPPPIDDVTELQEIASWPDSRGRRRDRA
jgi:glycosyltransferase involved in cell wall biosynthesis